LSSNDKKTHGRHTPRKNRREENTWGRKRPRVFVGRLQNNIKSDLVISVNGMVTQRLWLLARTSVARPCSVVFCVTWRHRTVMPTRHRGARNGLGSMTGCASGFLSPWLHTIPTTTVRDATAAFTVGLRTRRCYFGTHSPTESCRNWARSDIYPTGHWARHSFIVQSEQAMAAKGEQAIVLIVREIGQSMNKDNRRPGPTFWLH